jgi:hypothetical protein
MRCVRQSGAVCSRALNVLIEYLHLLLARCEANLKGTIRNDGIPNLEQLREGVEFA